MSEKCNKFKLYFVIPSFLISIALGVFGEIFILINLSKIFDDEDIQELKALKYLKPLNSILKDNLGQFFYYPLFGGYNGLKGGHKYKKCKDIFDDTCQSDKGKKYCPSDDYDEDSPRKELDKKTCVDYPTIIPFDYINFMGENYYAEKRLDNFYYGNLLNHTVKEGEKCPINTKKCGYLNEELILCLSNSVKCPINDIIINDKMNYSENNINYQTISFIKNKFIHFTNEKIENQIIFDLVLSIEHPLSKFESNNNQIFKLHQREEDNYYNGNIEKIKVYKKLYNTEITLKELLESYNKFEEFKNMPDYKTKFFNSKLYIYKKYPISPHITEQQCMDIEKEYEISHIFTVLMAVFLVLTVFPSFPFCCTDSKIGNITRIICYSFLSIFHCSIFVFFFLKLKTLTNPGILVHFSNKRMILIKLLLFRISFLITAFLTNVFSIYAWVIDCKEKRENLLDFSKEIGETPFYDKE